MKKFLSAVLTFWFLSACTRKPDLSKFQPVYRAAKAIQASTTVGVNKISYQNLLQAYATEMSILNDQQRSEREQKIWLAYSEIFQTYRDAGRLWDLKDNFLSISSGEGWTAHELQLRSYMSPQEIAAVAAEKFRALHGTELAALDRKYPGPTDFDKAVQRAWSKADSKLAAATALLNGQ